MISKQLVEHALDVLDSLQSELQKGLEGGVIAGYFLREKFDLLGLDIKMIERHGVDTVEGCEEEQEFHGRNMTAGLSETDDE